MDSFEAQKILEIPILTESEVKNAYRRLAKKHHPDLGGDAYLFNQVTEAYNFAMQNLIKLPDEVNPKTISGIPISELGKGFGPLENGATCDQCEGKGYWKSFEPYNCPDCNGSGRSSYSNCRDCNGTGKFTLRSKRVVECRKCKGTGQYKYHHDNDDFSDSFSFFFRSFNRNPCKKCSGTGSIKSEHLFKYHICVHCSGIGEIKMMNPVLKKGSILFSRR